MRLTMLLHEGLIILVYMIDLLLHVLQSSENYIHDWVGNVVDLKVGAAGVTWVDIHGGILF